MPTKDAVIVNAPRELEVPTFSKKEIIKFVGDADEASDYEEVIALVNEGLQKGDIDVVEGLVGKDISVEGITSKGIANTGNIANIGDIGATGKITGGEIIENMSGYGVQVQTTTKGTLDVFYSGAVKNGNKLTIVSAFYFTKNSDASGGLSVIRVLMPQDIIAKIVPADEVSASLIYNQFLLATPEGGGNPVQVIGNIVKYDSNSIYVSLRDLAPLTEGVKYYIRQEATFLLGQNLIPEE